MTVRKRDGRRHILETERKVSWNRLRYWNRNWKSQRISRPHSLCSQVLETVNLMAGGYPHRMRFKTFNLRYRLLVPFKKLRRAEDKTVEDCKLILEYFVRSLEDVNKTSTVAIQWALGKRHIFLRLVLLKIMQFFSSFLCTAEIIWNNSFCAEE